MQIISTLNFGSFPGKIMFSTGYTHEEVLKELKIQKCTGWLLAWKETKYLFSEHCGGFASKRTVEIKGEKYDFNFLHITEPFNFSDRHHSILAHEAIHLCTFHLSTMIDIVKENEAFAYTHTHILNQCYKVLRDAKKKK